MDRELIKSAQMGKVDLLHKFIEDDPLLLYRVSLSGGNSPLHVASMAGHLNFVQEIMKLRKEFAQEFNQEGLSPLHIASANGYEEIVKELLRADNTLCLLKGRDRRVALHYAAIRGRTRATRELLVSSPDSIEETTARGESAIHLAVKNNQFEVLVLLVEYLKEFKKEDVLNKKDEQGNTILHLAIARKQYEVIDLLLGQNSICKAAIKVNSENKNGLTPLDILFQFQSEAGDREIEEILRQACATMGSRNNSSTVTTNLQNQRSVQEERGTSPARKLVKYFTYDSIRDSPSEVRNTLLVIASLITIATYQAILQPPGGVWQDDSLPGNGTRGQNHIAGKSVMGYNKKVSYGIFLCSNSIGLHTSLHMIYILTSGFPLRLELLVAMISLTVTYNTCMIAISPKGALSTLYIVISILIPALIPIGTEAVRNYSKWLGIAPSSQRLSMA